jgi:LemA protein
VRSRESTIAQWKQVETDYQRRFDLIPNLVESVKGTMKQEQDVFTAIADARTKYSGATNPSEKAVAATQVETALGRLLAVVESYPTLKSSENVTNLMTQLEGTENRISVQRQRYNDSVKVFNTSIKVFPRSVVASIFGFDEIKYFEADKGSEKAPSVKF